MLHKGFIAIFTLFKISLVLSANKMNIARCPWTQWGCYHGEWSDLSIFYPTHTCIECKVLLFVPGFSIDGREKYTHLLNIITDKDYIVISMLGFFNTGNRKKDRLLQIINELTRSDDNDITKYFDSNKRHNDDVTITMQRGTPFGLIGHSQGGQAVMLLIQDNTNYEFEGGVALLDPVDDNTPYIGNNLAQNSNFKLSGFENVNLLMIGTGDLSEDNCSPCDLPNDPLNPDADCHDDNLIFAVLPESGNGHQFIDVKNSKAGHMDFVNDDFITRLFETFCASEYDTDEEKEIFIQTVADMIDERFMSNDIDCSVYGGEDWICKQK